MLSREWTREDMPVLCDVSKTYLQIAQQGLFANLTSYLSQEQYQAALQNLTALYEELGSKLNPFHFASPSNSGKAHFCLADAFSACKFRLKSWAILTPPPAPPVPAPRKRILTPQEVIQTFEDAVKGSPKQTFLGKEREEHEP
jgi:hypothetical protein